MALPRREGLTFPNHPIYPIYPYQQEIVDWMTTYGKLSDWLYGTGHNNHGRVFDLWKAYRDYYPRERVVSSGLKWKDPLIYGRQTGKPWQNVATYTTDVNLADVNLAEIDRRIAAWMAKKQLYAFAFGMSPTKERTNVDSNEKDMIERELPRLRDSQAMWTTRLAALRLEEQEQHARVNQAEQSLSRVTADILTKEKRLKDIARKFQPGDTVIHVDRFFPGEQKVLEYSSTGNVLVSGPNPNKLPWYCTESNLRKVTPRRFKVGDRVNTGENHIVTITAVGYDTVGRPWFNGTCTCGFPALEQLERATNFIAIAAPAKPEPKPEPKPFVPGTLVERKSVGRKAVITTTDTYRAMTGFPYPLALGQVPVVWLDDGRAGWAWIADLTTG